MSDTNKRLISDAVADIVSSFAARDNASVEEILALARQLPGALVTADQFLAGTSETTLGGHTVTAQPAVAIDQSVSESAVTCLCCGRSFTMLKRHIKAEHGLSEGQYRAQFGLHNNHPLVAPNYSVRKAEYAKQIGLGKHARDHSESQGAGTST